jgi:hypothetical protein
MLDRDPRHAYNPSRTVERPRNEYEWQETKRFESEASHLIGDAPDDCP